MATIEFVHDPAVEKELGADTVAALHAAVDGRGECIFCGDNVGSGKLRLSVQTTDFHAMAAAVHASCGGGVAAPAVAFMAGSTWQMDVVADRVTTTGRKRFWQRSAPVSSRPLVVAFVKPACDVFTLTRSDSGGFDDPLAIYRSLGLRPLGDGFEFEELDPSVPAVALRGTDLHVQLIGQFNSPAPQNAAEVIREAGGVLVGITFAPMAHAGLNTESYQEAMRGGQSVFAWVPAERIKGL